MSWPKCPACGKDMEVCDSTNPAHKSHDAASPHWAALHSHGGRPEDPENGLIFFGVEHYMTSMELE